LQTQPATQSPKINRTIFYNGNDPGDVRLDFVDDIHGCRDSLEARQGTQAIGRLEGMERNQVSFGVSLLALPAARAQIPASQFTPAAILSQEKLRGGLLLDWRTMAGVVTKSTLKKYCAPLLSRRLVVF
jgi:hypothetical protein